MPVKSKSTQLSENKLARNEPSGHYAVVDIGSNSVRLVVYDRLSRAPLPRFNEKSLCRLADGLAETGELSEESCQRTLEAVRRFRAIADAMKVDRVDSIATEAVRRATNGAQLLARIAKETGFNVQVLSGAEEARFASLGVLACFHQPEGVVGDMGGGSLEVSEISNQGVSEFSASMRWARCPCRHCWRSQEWTQNNALMRSWPRTCRMACRGLSFMLLAEVGAPLREFTWLSMRLHCRL